MAIDVKEILAESVLQLCTQKPLDKITIKDILNKSGVSRQSFYNHFLDKNDLIQYIYTHKVIVGFTGEEDGFDFYSELLKTFKNVVKYKEFMIQACKMDGQNCLKDFMFDHCKEFDLQWHQKLYGDTEMPEALKFTTIYHANASSSMTLSWILSGMSASPEEMADLITKLRSVGMEELFENAKVKGNPYRRRS